MLIYFIELLAYHDRAYGYIWKISQISEFSKYRVYRYFYRLRILSYFDRVCEELSTPGRYWIQLLHNMISSFSGQSHNWSPVT